MFTTETTLTITDTLESARDNAQDLLNVAIEDGHVEEIETLTEAVAGYQKALDEFDNFADSNGGAVDLDRVNDVLTGLAQEAGVNTNSEGVDETLDDLTHTVADALGIR